MKVIVIGGGPAGCTAAYGLKKHGHDLRVFEATHCVGGRTKQLKRDGFNLPTGALFLRPNPTPSRLCFRSSAGRSVSPLPSRPYRSRCVFRLGPGQAAHVAGLARALAVWRVPGPGYAARPST
jgi:phytoene dehydrogenase-like protein